MRKVSNDPYAWFAKAEAGISVAELVLQADTPYAEIAYYHAQQCAEKYLKGYLVSQHPFKFVHELAYLVRLCMGADGEFEFLLNSAAELQDYATDVRYPSEEFDPPTTEEAQEALERAKLIQQFVLKKMES